MKYGLLPRGMWLCYRASFRRELPRMTDANPAQVMKRAKRRYRAILAPLLEFDRHDPFRVNILSAALLAAVYLELPEKPDGKQVEDFYHRAMTENAATRAFVGRKDRFTAKAQKKLARQAAESVRLYEANPYTWCFTFEPGTDLNSYTTVFTTCGIKRLFEELGIGEITPAMCTYDTDMAELGGSEFTRQYTLAGGGPCCDCQYRKKE